MAVPSKMAASCEFDVALTQRLPWEHIAKFLSLQCIVRLSCTCKWVNRRLKAIDLSHLETIAAFGCVDTMLGYAQAWPTAPLLLNPHTCDALEQLLFAAEAANVHLFGLRIGTLNGEFERLTGDRGGAQFNAEQFLPILLGSPQLGKLRALALPWMHIEESDMAEWQAMFRQASTLRQLQIAEPALDFELVLALEEISQLETLMLHMDGECCLDLSHHHHERKLTLHEVQQADVGYRN